MPIAKNDVQCDHCGYMIFMGDEYKKIKVGRETMILCYSCSTDDGVIFENDR